MSTPLKIQIIVDDKGSVKIRQVGTEAEKAGRKGEESFRRTGRSIDEMNRKAVSGHSHLMKLAGAAVSLGVLYLAFRKINQEISEFVDLAGKQEAVEKRVEAVLKATGQAAGYNLSQLKAMASGMQDLTTVGDEVILSGQAILLTFKKIRGEGFERATMAALDMAEVMEGDLKGSIVMIGKALNDPIANLSAMTRAGVQFTAGQKDMIKQLWQSGKEIEAQNIILKELESQFGGTAAAARKSFAGIKKAAGNAYGDMQEQIGFIITKSPVVIDFIEKQAKWFIKAGKAIADWVSQNRKLIDQKIADILHGIKRAAKVAWEAVKLLVDNFGALLLVVKALIAVKVGMMLANIAQSASLAVAQIGAMTKAIKGMQVLLVTMSATGKGGLLGLILFGSYEIFSWAIKKVEESLDKMNALTIAATQQRITNLELLRKNLKATVLDQDHYNRKLEQLNERLEKEYDILRRLENPTEAFSKSLEDMNAEIGNTVEVLVKGAEGTDAYGLSAKEAAAKVKELAAAIAEANKEVTSGLYSGEWEMIPDQRFAGYGDVSASVENMEELKDIFTDLDDLMKAAATSFDGQSFGDSLASGINNAVISMNELIEMYEKQGKIEQELIKQRAEAEKLQGQDRLDALSKISNIETAMMGEQLGAWRQFFGTTKAMFEEGSKERELFAKAEMAATMAQIAVQAVLAIAAQGTGDPYTAWARIAAMAALMGTLVSQVGISISGGGGSAPQALPASSVLGADAGTPSESIANAFEMLEDAHALEYRELRNIYHEIQDLNQNITGLVTSIVREGGIEGFSTTDQVFEAPVEQLYASFHKGASKIIQWVVDPLSKFLNDFVGQAIGWIAGKIFGGEVDISVTGAGIDLGDISMGGLLGGAAIPARQYMDIHKEKEGGWFGSDEHWYWTEYQELSENVNRLLTSIFLNLSESMVSISTGLGADNMQAVLDYVIEVGKVNLQNMNAEQVNEAISAMMSNLSDKMAEDLFGDIITKYQQIDEGLYETAVRLVVEKEVLLNVLDLTGQAFDGTAREAVDFSQAIIEVAGDLENLTNIADAYYEAFFTDAEKHALLTDNLTGIFSDMNTVLPDTREGYKDLVEGLDLTTDSGKETYIALLDLAEASGQYYDSLEDAVKQLADAERALSETNMESVVRGVIDDFKSIYEALGIIYGLSSQTVSGMLHEVTTKQQTTETQIAELPYKAYLKFMNMTADSYDLQGLSMDMKADRMISMLDDIKQIFGDDVSDRWKTQVDTFMADLGDVDLREGTLTELYDWVDKEVLRLQSIQDATGGLQGLEKQLLALQEAAERLAEFEKRQLVAMKVDMGLQDKEVFEQFRFDEITDRYAEFGRTFQQTVDWFSGATLDDIKAVADALEIDWMEIANDVAFLIGHFEDAAALADRVRSTQYELLGITKEKQLEKFKSKYGITRELTPDYAKELIDVFANLSVDEVIRTAEYWGVTVDELLDDLLFLKGAFEIADEAVEDFAKAVKENFAQIKEDIEFFNWSASNPNKTSADYWLGQINTMKGRLIDPDNPLTQEDLVTMSELVTKWYDAAVEAANVWIQVADSVTNLVSQLDNVSNNIRHSSLNVGLPAEKYQDATKTYDELKLAARAGGTSEIQEYLGFVQTYLQTAQAEHKSDETYQGIYAAVMGPGGDLETIKAKLETGDYDQKIYDELTNIDATLQEKLDEINQTFLGFESWINLALEDIDVFIRWIVKFETAEGQHAEFLTFLQLIDEEGWESPVTLYFTGEIEWGEYTPAYVAEVLRTIDTIEEWQSKAVLEFLNEINWETISPAIVLDQLKKITDLVDPETGESAWTPDLRLTFTKAIEWGQIEYTFMKAYIDQLFTDLDLDSPEALSLELYMVDTGGLAWADLSAALIAAGYEEQTVKKNLQAVYLESGVASVFVTWDDFTDAWAILGMADQGALKTLEQIYDNDGAAGLQEWSKYLVAWNLAGMDSVTANKTLAALYTHSTDPSLSLWSDFEREFALTDFDDAEAKKTIKAMYDTESGAYLPDNWADFKTILEASGATSDPSYKEIEIQSQFSDLSAEGITFSSLQTMLNETGLPWATIRNIQAAIIGEVEVGPITFEEQDVWKAQIGLLIGILQNTALTANALTGWAQNLETVEAYWKMPTDVYDYISANSTAAYVTANQTWSHDPNSINPIQADWQKSIFNILSEMLMYTSFLPSISALLGGYSMTEGTSSSASTWIEGIPWVPDQGAQEVPRMVDYLAQIAANTGITAMALTQQTLTQQGIDPWATITATDYFTGDEYTTTQANWAVKVSQTAYDNFLKGYQIDSETGEWAFIADLWQKITDPLQQFGGGGIATGPESGYPVMLHGTEVVATIPQLAQLINGGSTRGGANNEEVGLLRELVALQKEQIDTLRAKDTAPKVNINLDAQGLIEEAGRYVSEKTRRGTLDVRAH